MSTRSPAVLFLIWGQGDPRGPSIEEWNTFIQTLEHSSLNVLDFYV